MDNCIREKKERREKEYLSEYATLSCDATRSKQIKKCDVRTDFQRDRDRILHCKSFRRLKHKTQVFLSPRGDHYHTRLTHTLQVSQIARTLASALDLNEDLTEAIALGHDLGHTPFGHAGERALQTVKPDFEHNVHGIRVVEYLENSVGMNLTEQVKDGILNHKKRLKPNTNEGMLVNYSDRIAYINHDIDDAIRAGILNVEDLPNDAIELFGKDHSSRIESLIFDIIDNSGSEIKMSKEASIVFDNLRTFMFKNVYTNSVAKSQEGKAQEIVLALYHKFVKKPELLPQTRIDVIDKYGKQQVVIDYIASMSDGYVIKVYSDLFVPSVWSIY